MISRIWSAEWGTICRLKSSSQCNYPFCTSLTKACIFSSIEPGPASRQAIIQCRKQWILKYLSLENREMSIRKNIRWLVNTFATCFAHALNCQSTNMLMMGHWKEEMLWSQVSKWFRKVMTWPRNERLWFHFCLIFLMRHFLRILFSFIVFRRLLEPMKISYLSKI